MTARTAFAAIAFSLLAHTALAAASSRPDVEAALPVLAANYQATAGNIDAARAYAQALFTLGDLWKAETVIAPVAAAPAATPEDLRLAGRVALMLGHYANSEKFYRRLLEDPQNWLQRYQAVEGLTLTYYQTNEYRKSYSLHSLPIERLGYMHGYHGVFSLLEPPYQIEWMAPDRVARLPIINDISVPGSMPIVKLTMNGKEMQFAVDMGGDRVVIDRISAARLRMHRGGQRLATYPETDGGYIRESLATTEDMTFRDVKMTDVPIIITQWKLRGEKTDGVLTAQFFKQFLTTIDYDHNEIVLRPRDAGGHAAFQQANAAPLVTVPFFMTEMGLIYAKGSIEGHDGLNFLVNSSLLPTPLGVRGETADMLHLGKMVDPDKKSYMVSVQSYGLGSLIEHDAAASGLDFLINENPNNSPRFHYPYLSQGFFFDAAISQGYFRRLGSWTIDFDAMNFYFPARQAQNIGD